MTSPLDEKAVTAAHEAYAKTTGGLLDGNPMANAIRAYLSATALPDGMEIDWWILPDNSMAFSGAGWAVYSKDVGPEGWEEGEYDAWQESVKTAVPAVTLSQAQSALTAMRVERDEALLCQQEIAAGTDKSATVARIIIAKNEAENRADVAEYKLNQAVGEIQPMIIARVEAAEAQVQRLTEENEGLRKEREALTYSSTQSTRCPCGNVKHTPLRRDHMGGYVCLTCIDKELDRLREMEVSTEARIKALEEALSGLEFSCDVLASTRSAETYQRMIDVDKASEALSALDAARRAARATLNSRGKATGGLNAPS